MFARGVNRYHKSHIAKMRLRFGCALLAFTAACIVFIFEPFGVDAPCGAVLLAIPAMVSVLYYSLEVFGRGYCCFHPYFTKRLPTDSTLGTYGGGQAIAARLDELDDLARQHDIVPLSSFGYKDHYLNANLDWYAPADGLRTINWLIERYKTEQPLGEELKAIKTALELAARSDIAFCFHMKFADAANLMEHEQREGSCF